MLAIRKTGILWLFIAGNGYSFSPPADTSKYANGSYALHKGNTIYYYSQHNQLTHKTTRHFLLRNRQILYDTSGTEVAKGPVKYFCRHGRWKLKDTNGKRIVHYRYGFTKAERFTPGGKRMRILLTYGITASRGVNKSSRTIYVPAAGCVISHRLIFRIKTHNLLAKTFVR